MNDSNFNAALAESGAVFEGCAIPSHFGGPRAEYLAGRETAALFDVSDRAQIEATGDDRTTFLHGFCTNDVKRLEPGEGCEAFVTNIKGRVLAHVWLFVEERSIWIETVAAAEEGLIAHLDRYLITEDVQLQARTAQFGELFVSGPRAVPALAAAGLAAPEPRYRHAQVEGVRLRRVDWFGLPGVLLSAPRADLPALWRRLARIEGLHPAGAQAFHALRIEAVFPLYGADVTEGNLAQEVDRTAEAISFTKGCYLGQEPIARVDALGHVNRVLRGLRVAGDAAPQVGAAILDPEEGGEIGRITSATVLPTGEAALALGYLRSAHAAVDTPVAIDSAGGRLSAAVFHR